MMDMDFSNMLPGSLQAYANFGMAVVVILVGLIGYLRKLRAGSDDAVPANVEANRLATHSVVLDWLDKIHAAVMNNTITTKEIVELLRERARHDELEREYQRGRDDSEDRTGHRGGRPPRKFPFS